MALDTLHSFVDRIALMPGLRQARQLAFDRYFEHNPGMNLFRGLFSSREEAIAAIPSSSRAGYDSEDATELYVDWLHLFDYDYPALFWVQRSLLDGMRSVFDLGGNIGIKYFAFGKVAQFPEDIRWTVADVPAVVRRGQRFAEEKGAARVLRFTERLEDTDGQDLLFASGSVQYLPLTLGELLAKVDKKPRRVLLNISAFHDQHSYYTVNSFGRGFAPYFVQQRDAFVRSLEALGYALRDSWKNEGKTLDLPFDPGYGLDHYSGFCFDLR